MLKLLMCLGLFGGVLIAGTAQATMVDLTDGSWSGFHGKASASRNFDGNKVTFSTGRAGRLQFNQGYDGGGSCASCKTDGVGIGDDEIGRGESLTVTFKSAVTLNSVQFLDLYAEGKNGEIATMLINFEGGSDERTFYGMDVDGGYLLSEESFANVLSIEFSTDDTTGTSDFALAGLEFEWAEKFTSAKTSSEAEKQDGQLVKAMAIGPSLRIAQSVPAPGPLWLMLIGLLMIGLTGIRARRLRRSLPVLAIRP